MAMQASDVTVAWPIGRLGRVASLALAVILIIGSSVLSYRAQQDLLQAGEAVEHTRQVLYQVERLLSLTKDVGSGVRNYLVTGDEEFLAPYRAAVAAMPDTIAQVRDLTADNPAQRKRLEALQPLIDDRLAATARIIEAGRSQGPSALTPELAQQSKDVMDRIRDIAAAMTKEEIDLDQVRTERVQTEARWAGYPLLAGTLLSLIVVLILFVQMHREVMHRREAEAALQRLNANLEDRVRERTETLAAAEQRYRRVVDLIQEAIWIHVDGAIVFANPAAAKLFGTDTPDALIGRSIFSLLHPDDRARALARTQTATAERRAVPVAEMRLLGLDGRERIGELHAVPFMQDQKLHMLSAGRDVTAQRQAEAQLQQAQKMEAVGQLTGGIAHDFNNLLTVILGSLDWAQERADSTVRPAMESALRAAERGSGLVRQLLAFSRRQTLIPESLDLRRLTTAMEDLLRRTLGDDIEIEMNHGAGLWPALADRGQVESALLNLAINARDAMPAGGKLTIETANAPLDADYAARNAEVTPGDYVVLAVTDTGSGMPPEVVERAFEPFFTTKEVGRGSGLGLSMIYGFAKQSGGHLKIYSEVAHGTTVRLYLPRQRGEGIVAPSPLAVPKEQPRGGETILVVEDDVDVRAFVLSQLRDLGYRVIEAADGPQAQRVLASDAPVDLLFTDVVMPGGMTGRQIADAAKRQRPQLKTLFTSGYTENSIVHQGKLDKGVNFLSKPYKRQDLAAAIRAALDTPA